MRWIFKPLVLARSVLEADKIERSRRTSAAELGAGFEYMGVFGAGITNRQDKE